MDLLRVSDGEPTLGKTHLLQLLDAVQGKECRFILETNGILIVYNEGYTVNLSKYNSIHLRVSLKGCNEEEFVMLTGAKPEGFTVQLKALQNLTDAEVSCHPSVMVSFSSRKTLQAFIQRLKQISPRLAEKIEVEELILYPYVVKRIRKHGLKYSTTYTTEGVLLEQI